MNPMLNALKKKLMEHGAGHMEAKSDHPEDQNDSAHENDDVAGPAPHLDHEDPEHEAHEAESVSDASHHMDAAKEDMQHLDALHNEQSEASAYEGSPMHMDILKGLSDHGVMGRSPMGLKERAGAGAKDKMVAIEAMRKKQGKV